MDKRARFWQDIYEDFATSKEHENEVNVYSVHGWEARHNVFRQLLGQLRGENRLPVGALAADFGCGSGRYSAILSEHGVRVVSGDLCLQLLEYASKAHPEIDHLTRLDCRHLPYADGVFDVAICFGVISIITEPESTLQELLRVTKPSGTVMIMALNKLYFETLYRSKSLEPDLTIIEYSPFGLQKRMRSLSSGAKVDIIPIFIFHRWFRFLEPLCQRLEACHALLMPFASAFIIKVEKG